MSPKQKLTCAFQIENLRLHYMDISEIRLLQKVGNTGVTEVYVKTQ